MKLIRHQDGRWSPVYNRTFRHYLEDHPDVAVFICCALCLLLLLMTQPAKAEDVGYTRMVNCVALAVYWESASSNQPIADQYGVALVAVGRAKDSQRDACEVVFEPHQFTSLDNSRDHRGRLKKEFIPHGAAWKQARNIAQSVMRGDVEDFTQGARFYHADYIPNPYWTAGKTFTGKFGKHLYWR